MVGKKQFADFIHLVEDDEDENIVFDTVNQVEEDDEDDEDEDEAPRLQPKAKAKAKTKVSKGESALESDAERSLRAMMDIDDCKL